MKTEKPDVRVFCRRCWREYIYAGINLLPIYTEFKDDCFKCGNHNGYEYVEVKKRKKQYD